MNIKQAAFYAVAMVAGVPLITELIRLYCTTCNYLSEQGN